MRRFIPIVAAGLLSLGLLPRLQAFSLIGPFPEWQTQEIGYQIDINEPDLGGPMNLGEEYRHNLPLLTYGFDPSFVNYFGQRGIEEVEKAIAILNDALDLDKHSPDLHEFPLDTRRINYRASALGLFDLKSFVLGTMLEQLGLAPAERYVWTLRSRVVIDDVPVYVVIQRNFDPITGLFSPYVNGSLYTYAVRQTYSDPDPDVWEAVEIPVDPTLPHVSSVSAANMMDGTVFAPGVVANASPGLFYTGLTRDDVAGLRYLYRQDNYNVETAPTNIVRSLTQEETEPVLLTQDDSGNPWGPPGGLTNVVGTNLLAAINQALRPGVGRLQLKRVEYDSVIGFFLPVTNRWTDRFITNNVLSKQTVERVLTFPDIVFAAADLGVNAQGIPILSVRTLTFQNNEALNRGPGSTALDGPGTINVGQTITISKLGPSLIHIGEGGTQATGTPAPWWAAFDGTDTEPYVFPEGESLRRIEESIATGAADTAQSPWAAPALLIGNVGGNTQVAGGGLGGVIGAGGTGGLGGAGGTTGVGGVVTP